MRKLRHAFLVLSAIFISPASPAATLGDPQIGFAADRTLVIDGRSYVGKIWAMPGRQRHEQTIHAFRPVFLLRGDSPFGEIVLAQMKTIVQFQMPPELRLLDVSRLIKHPAGRETVNGVATTRYAIDESVPEGHATGALWLSRDGIPMKLAGNFTRQNGKVATILWELNHVKIGPQPTDLFEEPHGFSKLPPEAVAPLLGLKLKSPRR